MWAADFLSLNEESFPQFNGLFTVNFFPVYILAGMRYYNNNKNEKLFREAYLCVRQQLTARMTFIWAER